MNVSQRYVALHPSSRRLAERARSVFPDGVTHDMRHNTPFPIYVVRADRSRKTDVDGNTIVDFVMGHGALLLGHNHPAVVRAVSDQLPNGTHLGASHEREIEWGELVQRLVPSAERVRFTSSGTEATMMAVRLARRYTGRDQILRLKEHFHGWNDSVTGQPPAESTLPTSPGLPRATLESSVVIPQNDLAILKQTLMKDGDSIAAVILEPTGPHWGEDPIDMDYVRDIRALTTQHDVLLIFDEVITGFRVSPGGAQQVYGIMPDMTTLAKIVAGGLPGGCVAGRADVLDQISIGAASSRDTSAPDRISHPGTFNANPLSAAAGSACLTEIADGGHQEKASATAATIARALNRVLREESVAGCAYGYASMLHIALGPNEPPPDGYSWHGVAPQNPLVHTAGEIAHLLRLAMLNEGVDMMGDGMMVSSVHDQTDVDHTIEAFRRSIQTIKLEATLTA